MFWRPLRCRLKTPSIWVYIAVLKTGSLCVMGVLKIVEAGYQMPYLCCFFFRLDRQRQIDRRHSPYLLFKGTLADRNKNDWTVLQLWHSWDVYIFKQWQSQEINYCEFLGEKGFLHFLRKWKGEWNYLSLCQNSTEWMIRAGRKGEWEIYTVRLSRWGMYP